ncbi:MAG TPA: hypothetical protein VMU95_00020 [Trebonia sp.]|nr:hypothetical protein [Trebonia sp.]
MEGMTPYRLRLWADPSRLDRLDGPAALDGARTRLRQRRGDFELVVIERLPPDSIAVIFLAAPAIRGEDVDQFAAVLRELLEIGPGTQVLLPAQFGEVIPSQGSTCPDCRATDGSHVPGCPRGRR